MSTPVLVGIPYSPWSVRARWVLEHVGFAHRWRGYVPGLGEPRLRLDLRRPWGPVSVPVLFADRVYEGSTAIAERAGALDPDVLPDGWLEIERVADEAQRSGRRLAGLRVLADPAAIAASTPGFARPLGALGHKLTADGWKRVLAKYREPGMTDPDHRSRQVAALATLTERVGDGPFVFDRFGYADILVVLATSFVDPPALLGLVPDQARAWGDPELAERFADLITWREDIIREHRPGSRPHPTAASP